MSELVLLHGEIVEAAEARVSVFDAGLAHGAGLFETVRVYHGNPFRLDEHLRRMRQSGQRLGIALPWDDAELTRGVERVLQANELRDARLRITATPGDARTAESSPEDASPPATLLIAAQAFDSYPAEHYRRGMTVCVSSFKQSRNDPLAGHKTLSYFPRLLALREAHARQCGEALWFTADNRLAEGSISNVFLVSNEKLLTPPLDTPVLPGVARKVVLEGAAAERIAAEERALTIDDLLAADEVFLTNVILEVMPVCRVERHAVGDEKVGEITRRLHEAYRRMAARECRIGA
jgi:D-amino acid aminotransferase